MGHPESRKCLGWFDLLLRSPGKLRLGLVRSYQWLVVDSRGTIAAR